MRLVAGDVALLAVGVGVGVLQVRRVRPDVVVEPAGLRCAVAAQAREDHHEEVDDAVLVGVVAVVVDLRIGDRRGVEHGLAGRPAAGVDVLQRADACQRADQRRPLPVLAVVGRVARELVPAVLDPVAGLVTRRQRGVRVRRALRLRLGERELAGAPRGARDRLGRHRRVREQLAVGDLLVEVERRARVGRVVDLVREPGGGRRGGVLAVAIVDRHDRERTVAVTGGLVPAGGRDDLWAPSCVGQCAERRGRGQVLPHDLGVLGERVRGRLHDLDRASGRAVRMPGLDGRHVPGGGRQRRAIGRGEGHARARERRRAVVEDAHAERVRLARLHPPFRGHEVGLEHHLVGRGGDAHRTRLGAVRRLQTQRPAVEVVGRNARTPGDRRRHRPVDSAIGPDRERTEECARATVRVDGPQRHRVARRADLRGERRGSGALRPASRRGGDEQDGGEDPSRDKSAMHVARVPRQTTFRADAPSAVRVLTIYSMSASAPFLPVLTATTALNAGTGGLHRFLSLPSGPFGSRRMGWRGPHPTRCSAFEVLGKDALDA